MDKQSFRVNAEILSILIDLVIAQAIVVACFFSALNCEDGTFTGNGVVCVMLNLIGWHLC